MAKLTRILHKIFGASATSDQMSVYGSYKNGSTTPSLDPAVISGQANWLQGMPGGVIGRNSPLIEEMNGLFFHTGRQLGYLFQQGIPEYDPDTTYYIGSFCTLAGVLYCSLADDNLDNLVSDVTKWKKVPTAEFPYYASTALFETDRGAAVTGSFFYDTALYCFRYYLDGVWKNRGDYVSCNIGAPVGGSPAAKTYIPSCTITLPVGKWKLKVDLNLSVQASVNTGVGTVATVWLTTEVTTTDVASRSVYVTSPATVANCDIIVGAPVYFTKEVTLTSPMLYRLHYNTDSYAVVSAGADNFSAERIL